MSQVSSELASQVKPPPPKGIWTHVKKAAVWLATAPSRWSTPAKAAWALFFVLLLLVALALTMFWLDPSNGPWRHLISWQWGAMVGVLAVATPWVAYRGLRLWLEGDMSLFPEIDYAWSAGLAALEEHGIELKATPVYLILGSANEEQEAAIVNAAGRRLRVSGIPEGPAPLHWYANPDAIYIFATDASYLSALATLKERDIRPSAAALAPVYAADMASEESASEPQSEPQSEPEESLLSDPASQEPQPPRGTIMLDQFVAKEAAERVASERSAESTPEPDASPTQTTGRLTMYSDFVNVASEHGPAVLSSRESSQRSQQLEYLCKLLSQARSPVCPVNGVVVMLPFEMVKGPPAEIEQLQVAVRSDLNVVHNGSHLRSPVTCLVTGLERERGFRELVRRVGREMATAQRFGQKFDTCQATTPDQMAALSAHVCGAFEDWVYTLFREEDSLSRAGNTRLYGLLCKVRCMLKGRLSQILSGGFGYDPGAAASPVAFSGCYFAATGSSKDRQAFVRGIFDKLDEEQELVEWTEVMLRESRRRRSAARLAIALNAALLVFAATMLVVKFSS